MGKILHTIILICLLIYSVGMPALPRFGEILIGGLTYSLLFVVTLQHWKRMLYVAKQNLLLTSLVMVALASFFWSYDAKLTFEEFKFLIRSTLVGLYLAVRYSPKEIMQLLAVTAFVALILCFGAGIVSPSTSIHVLNGVRSWSGIFWHKQTSGPYAAAAFSLFLIQLLTFETTRRYRLFLYVGVVLALLFVPLSGSKTALVVCAFTLAMLPLYRIAKLGESRPLMFLVAFIVLCTTATLLILNLETIVVGWLGRDLSFNGRMPIWTLAVQKGLERPLLGYGYHAFWGSDASDDVINYTWASGDAGFRNRTVSFHSHNGFVDIFLQLGFIGIGLFAFGFFSYLRRVISLLLLTKSGEYFWMFVFSGIFLMNNFSEAMLILSSQYSWIIYVTLSFSSALEHKRMKRAKFLNQVEVESNLETSTKANVQPKNAVSSIKISRASNASSNASSNAPSNASSSRASNASSNASSSRASNAVNHQTNHPRPRTSDRKDPRANPNGERRTRASNANVPPAPQSKPNSVPTSQTGRLNPKANNAANHRANPLPPKPNTPTRTTAPPPKPIHGTQPKASNAGENRTSNLSNPRGNAPKPVKPQMNNPVDKRTGQAVNPQDSPKTKPTLSPEAGETNLPKKPPPDPDRL